MALEDKKPVIVTQHLYEGKIVDIWVSFQEDNPHNYVLGRSRQEAQEAFLAQPEIVVTVDPTAGGFRATCPKFKELVGSGASRREAERALMRKINLLSDRIDWREMFFEFVIATGIDYNEMGWDAKEVGAIRRELSRRTTAAQFGEPNEAALPKEGGRGYAETPFCD